MTCTHLAHLHRAYMRNVASAVTTLPPAGFDKPPRPAMFEQDIADLILRNTKTSTNSDNFVGTLPDKFMQAAEIGCSISMEHNSSPLTHSPHIPNYTSSIAQDSIFGAQHASAPHIFTGSSMVHPQHSAKAMDKAVRWAISSATSSDLPCPVSLIPLYMTW